MIYSSLVRKLYLKCCQQQDPAEFLLLRQITLNSEEILHVRPLLGISCVTSKEGCGGRSISSMVHGHKLLNEYSAFSCHDIGHLWKEGSFHAEARGIMRVLVSLTSVGG